MVKIVSKSAVNTWLNDAEIGKIGFGHDRVGREFL